MTGGKQIIYRIVAGTATDEDRAQLQHISAEKVKSMIRTKIKDILDRQKRRNVLRPGEAEGERRMMQTVFTPKQVAARWQCSERHIRKLADSLNI